MSQISQDFAFETNSDASLEDFSDSEDYYNQSYSMASQFVRARDIGAEHENESLFFIRSQLVVQSENIKWVNGYTDPMILSSHPVIDEKIYRLKAILEHRLNLQYQNWHSQTVECEQKDSRFEEEKSKDDRLRKRKSGSQSLHSWLILSHLHDRNSIQLDGLFFFDAHLGSEVKSLIVTDSKVKYTLTLPCVVLIEATRSNHTERLADKILRSAVNTAHVMIKPINFFPQDKISEQIKAQKVYCVLVTQGEWTRGLENLATIHDNLFAENDEIMNCLDWSRPDVEILKGPHTAKMSNQNLLDAQKVLADLPFALLNISDIDTEFGAELINGIPQFQLKAELAPKGHNRVISLEPRNQRGDNLNTPSIKKLKDEIATMLDKMKKEIVDETIQQMKNVILPTMINESVQQVFQQREQHFQFLRSLYEEIGLQISPEQLKLIPSIDLQTKLRSSEKKKSKSGKKRRNSSSDSSPGSSSTRKKKSKKDKRRLKELELEKRDERKFSSSKPWRK